MGFGRLGDAAPRGSPAPATSRRSRTGRRPAGSPRSEPRRSQAGSLEQAAVAGTAIVLFAFARRRIGGAAGWIAAGVFLTSGLVFATSRALNTDLFQLLFLTCALIALFEGSAGSVAATAAAGAFLGLAMLTKGPVALLVTIAVVVPFLVLRRGERRLPAAGVALGVLLFLAIGLPWYAIQIARDPSLLSWFIDRQVMARVADGTEGHRHGLLYLPAHILAGTLPWTPLVLLAAWRLRPRRGERLEALDVFLGCWLIAPCLVFELSATKLATYLLPAMPAAALLVPRAQRSGLMEDGRARGALVGALVIAAAAACAASVALVCARYGLAPAWLETSDLRAPAAFALALAASATLAGGLAVRTLLRPAHPSLRLPIAAIAAIFGLVGAAIAPAVRRPRARRHDRVRRRRRGGDRVRRLRARAPLLHRRAGAVLRRDGEAASADREAAARSRASRAPPRGRRRARPPARPDVRAREVRARREARRGARAGARAGLAALRAPREPRGGGRARARRERSDGGARARLARVARARPALATGEPTEAKQEEGQREEIEDRRGREPAEDHGRHRPVDLATRAARRRAPAERGRDRSRTP